MRTPGGSWRKAGRARASSFTSPKVRLPSSTSSRTLRLRLMRLMTEGPLSRLTLATFTSGIMPARLGTSSCSMSATLVRASSGSLTRIGTWRSARFILGNC